MRHWKENHAGKKPRELGKPPKGIQIDGSKQVDLCQWNNEKVKEYWWEYQNIDPSHRVCIYYAPDEQIEAHVEEQLRSYKKVPWQFREFAIHIEEKLAQMGIVIGSGKHGMADPSKADYDKYWKLWRETFQFEPLPEVTVSQPIKLTREEKEAAGPILPYHYQSDEEDLRI